MTDPDYDKTNDNEAEHSLTLPVCAQCQETISSGDEIQTENAVFCSTCYGQLKNALDDALVSQGQGINFMGAVAGGLAGSLLGALAWWGFVTATNIQFGLVAVLIGWGAGKGVVVFSGHRRAFSLQLISVALAAVGYALASYWVMRTLIQNYAEANNMIGNMPLFPDPALLIDVVSSGFEMFDFIFLAIVLWQAWKMPAPVTMNTGD